MIFNWATQHMVDEQIIEEEEENSNEKPGRTKKRLITKEAMDELANPEKLSTEIVPSLSLQIVDDAVFFISSGIEAIVEDEVTQCFHSQQIRGWNLLARTNNFSFFNLGLRMSIVWIGGFVWRWMIIFPWRLVVCIVGCLWMMITMSIVSIIGHHSMRLKMAYWANIVTFRIYTRALGAVVNYHAVENLPMNGSVCVANHTTILDVVTLSNHRPYALIGQAHGGALGWWQKRLARCTKHIWFERTELRDRQVVTSKLRAHCADHDNYPLLIFPEGTCVNNTSVLQFKKGSFEACDRVYPVAIKYNPWFGDAYWNSSKYGMLHYLMRVFTSWAIVADVYYLPVMHRRVMESPIDFANRCKSEIAQAGGLVDRIWDGQLKRSRVKQNQKDAVKGDLGKIFDERLVYKRNLDKKVPYYESSTDEES
ncbi:Oidioi.mRNA.OKI2018_I69.XSR.g14623.t2.cds [Oikopleura dioica]|uniref:Oidioi.mRNA.OKI2018_I69.XSR.g14623.t2.cds n=1 Tax=Oikopleura dioica TaxID=34765 RepID=A0ABN7SFK4_OIKDI|nr:Oidioi.mRNA.OKI2018_I69.XSR.g14623.t2.cds [Oikopleura dioica]